MSKLFTFLFLLLMMPTLVNADTLVVSDDISHESDPGKLTKKAKDLVHQDPRDAIRYGEQALNLLSEKTDQKLKLDVITVLAVAYVQTGQTERANSMVEHALQMGAELGDQPLAKALIAQASVAIASGRIEEAQEKAGEALAYFSPGVDSVLRMEALNIDGMALLYSEDAEGSIERFFEMLNLAKSLDLPERILAAEGNLGTALIVTGDYVSAEAHLLRAYGLIRDKSRPLMKLKLLGNLGIINSYRGETDSAIEYFTNALEIAQELDLKPKISMLLSNLADAYLLIPDYDRVIELSEEALGISREIGDSQLEAVSLVNLGHAYEAKNRLDDGIENFLKALALLEEAGDDLHVTELLAIISGAYEKAGGYSKALSFYKRFKAATDEKLTTRNRNRISELEEKYQREKEIEALTKKQIIQDAELRQQRLTFYGVTTGASLLVIVLAFLIKVLKGSRKAHLELSEAHTRLSEANRKLEIQTITDQLTGLFNRRHLYNIAPAEISKSIRRAKDDPDSEYEISFLILDADWFKKINDKWGHSIGDKVLKNLSQRLTEVVRDSDSLIRWGGEEFLIMSKECDFQCAANLAERIVSSVADRPMYEKLEINLTCSLGFATFPIFPGDPERFDWREMLKLADAALLQAKKSGRNTFVGVRAGTNPWEGETIEQVIQNFDDSREQKLIEITIPSYLHTQHE